MKILEVIGGLVCARVLALLCLLPLAANSMAEDATVSQLADACDEMWLKKSGEYADVDVPDYRGLLAMWLSVRPLCVGTVNYEARLAFSYAKVGDIENARKALDPVVDTKSPYAYLVGLVGVFLDGMELVSSNNVTPKAVDSLERRMKDVTSKSPKSVENLSMLAGLEADLGRHKEAIKIYETILQSDSGRHSMWGVFRNLAISYAADERYEDAYNAASYAIQARRSLMGDPQLVYAVAIADAGLGKFEAADTALKVILAKVPEVRNDPEFVAAIKFVSDRRKAAH